jgi:hypothetical protein
VHAGKPVAEFHNPHLGEAGEADWQPPAAPVARRVVVVGAGPGGLEAAWIAAARGHRVTLLGASPDAGGKARLEARLPGMAEMAEVTRHQLRMADRHGVELVLGARVTREQVLALDPDVVLVATGATMRAPEHVAATDSTPVSAHAFAAAWNPETPPGGGTALLYDHDHTAGTYAVAEALARTHAHTVLVTPRTQIAQAVNYCSAIGVYRRLYGLGVEIVTASEPVSWSGGVVSVANVFSGARREVGEVRTFVYATPRRADDALLRTLAAALPVHGIGDCMAPRNMLIAIHEGHRIACGI